MNLLAEVDVPTRVQDFSIARYSSKYRSFSVEFVAAYAQEHAALFRLLYVCAF